jgi:hypothetical protein
VIRFGWSFFLGWILSSSGMFALFYYWHGIFLNDFIRIQFPISWFIVFAAITYLLLGFGMSVLFDSRLFFKIRSFWIKTLITGLVSGLGLFMAATVVHISLTKDLSANHMLIDLSWQIFEQSMGALLVFASRYLAFILNHEQAE